MTGLGKTATTVLVVLGTVAVIGIGVLIVMNQSPDSQSNSNSNSNTSDSSTQSQSSSDANATDENLDNTLHDPSIPDAYYKGTVTITEKNTIETNAQVSMRTTTDTTMISNELIFYDNRTQTCYILARTLQYFGAGIVQVSHGKGVFNESGSISMEGEITELYGQHIKETTNYLDYTKLPVRMDIKKTLVYTMPQTERNDWVVTITSSGAEMGPPMLATPESLERVDIGLIPGMSTISIERPYSYKESNWDDATGGLVKPSGTFSCEYEKITESDYMALLAQFSALAKESENATEYIPDLPDLPADFPEDVLTVESDIDVITSETQIGDENEPSTYDITYTSNESVEDVISYYSEQLSQYDEYQTASMMGSTTISGTHKGYSVSIIIMKNPITGEDEQDPTLVQINLMPSD